MEPGAFSTNLPILNGKNWTRWCVQMKAIFGSQDVAEIVEEGFSALGKAPTDEQKAAYKENKKKDCRATVLIHQCVDEPHFEKIAGAATSEEAWKILEQCNERVKKFEEGQVTNFASSIRIDANGEQ